jgi:hypothetical protein
MEPHQSIAEDLRRRLNLDGPISIRDGWDAIKETVEAFAAEAPPTVEDVGVLLDLGDECAYLTIHVRLADNGHYLETQAVELIYLIVGCLGREEHMAALSEARSLPDLWTSTEGEVAAICERIERQPFSQRLFALSGLMPRIRHGAV